MEIKMEMEMETKMKTKMKMKMLTPGTKRQNNIFYLLTAGDSRILHGLWAVSGSSTVAAVGESSDGLRADIWRLMDPPRPLSG